jgi:hypothetical protein
VIGHRYFCLVLILIFRNNLYVLFRRNRALPVLILLIVLGLLQLEPKYTRLLGLQEIIHNVLLVNRYGTILGTAEAAKQL